MNMYPAGFTLCAHMCISLCVCVCFRSSRHWSRMNRPRSRSWHIKWNRSSQPCLQRAETHTHTPTNIHRQTRAVHIHMHRTRQCVFQTKRDSCLASEMLEWNVNVKQNAVFYKLCFLILVKKKKIKCAKYRNAPLWLFPMLNDWALIDAHFISSVAVECFKPVILAFRTSTNPLLQLP